MNTHTTPLTDAQQLDRADPLGLCRDWFDLPQGLVYLDGNSLGALPRCTAQRVAHTVQHEWGQNLIKSWNAAGWFDAPQRIGDLIAPLIGARAGEVVACDSTSVNLYKVLHAALMQQKAGSQKRVVLSERSNFPTDLYMAQSLCAQHGFELKLVSWPELPRAIDQSVAVLMLTHVHYRSGRMHDMAALTQAAHAAGALAIWDLAHSAGAVPVDLHGAHADYAVGCGYKYFNGGPGAPAFVWVNPKHANSFSQPLSGWWGHAQPFAFTPDYKPASGVGQYLCGTQPIVSSVALQAGLELFAQLAGGMQALREKSLALTDLFMQLVDEQTQGAWQLVTPREHTLRGSHVSYTCAEGGYAFVQALIARGVIGDFRAGDESAPFEEDRLPILRFGFAPLYNSYCDVWQAAQHIGEVLRTGEWRCAKYQVQSAVT
jgi:kynureninase